MDEEIKRRWEDEYDINPKSAERIIHVIDYNPTSLLHIADLCETAARICRDNGIPMCDAAMLFEKLYREQKGRNYEPG